MVISLPNIYIEKHVCEGCVYRKQHKLPFTKAPLELVYVDICGPTQTLSMNKKRYFLFFVNDFSRMMRVYFLEQKSEAFNIFLKFRVFVERQSGCMLKILLTDRGGEFISKGF